METEDQDLTEGGTSSASPQVISVGLIITLDQDELPMQSGNGEENLSGFV